METANLTTLFPFFPEYHKVCVEQLFKHILLPKITAVGLGYNFSQH